MNRRTKFYIGIMLVITSITTMFTFLCLCMKKKSALAALAALATAEGIMGLALIEDNSVKKKAAEALAAEDEVVDLEDEAVEVLVDEEASEEEFA